MSDPFSKPSIPAWQRPSSPSSPPALSPKDAPDAREAAEETGSTDSDAEDSAVPPESSDAQIDMVSAFLADPEIVDQPAEKKRAFLKSKEIPVETIDHVLQKENKPPASVAAMANATFRTSDFETFARQQQPAAAAQPAQTRASAPPIITYPEFLLNAHNPAPLVTPTRVLNTAYFAAGLATLVYGASTFLLTPMRDSLTAARHDFASHSSGKVDEFNDRLSKIVSKVPETRQGTLDSGADADEGEENASVVSDPTELYHRDMGTQTTSPPPSPLGSSSAFLPSLSGVDREKTQVDQQSSTLDKLNAHLQTLSSEMSSTQADAHGEQKERMGKLRHYLDTLQYGLGYGASTIYGQGYWDAQSNAVGGDSEKTASVEREKGREAEKAWEASVEGMKREIRGVKGVLLSARRFPGAPIAGRVGLAGT
ncbi:hypothetical protein LTR53_004776 [Teratosphaeriaceae sp. CCFEE 6253]|nr:hypothetical protein LTR53_004776 [Teratosphaeriaceae sp. CCFEE 6253]